MAPLADCSMQSHGEEEEEEESNLPPIIDRHDFWSRISLTCPDAAPPPPPVPTAVGMDPQEPECSVGSFTTLGSPITPRAACTARSPLPVAGCPRPLSRSSTHTLRCATAMLSRQGSSKAFRPPSAILPDAPPSPPAIRPEDGLMQDPLQLLSGLSGLRFLSKGGSSCVYTATLQGQRVAVKVLACDQGLHRASPVLREALLGSALQHPNIVASYLTRVARFDEATLEAALQEGATGGNDAANTEQTSSASYMVSGGGANTEQHSSRSRAMAGANQTHVLTMPCDPHFSSEPRARWQGLARADSLPQPQWQPLPRHLQGAAPPSPLPLPSPPSLLLQQQQQQQQVPGGFVMPAAAQAAAALGSLLAERRSASWREHATSGMCMDGGVGGPVKGSGAGGASQQASPVRGPLGTCQSVTSSHAGTNSNIKRMLAAAGMLSEASNATENPEDIGLGDVLRALGATPGTYVCLSVLELCTLGSLEAMCSRDAFSPLNRLGAAHAERLLLKLAKEVAQALEYLHENGLTHGDIKPGNVLLQQEAFGAASRPASTCWREGAGRALRHSVDMGRPSSLGPGGAAAAILQGMGSVAKLADWGLAGLAGCSSSGKAGQVGTIPYSAPERFEGGGEPPVDVYSFGILLWQMAAGRRPYASMHVGQIMVGVCCRGLRPEWPAGRHALLRALYERCVAQEPEQRPTAPQLVAELSSLEQQV